MLAFQLADTGRRTHSDRACLYFSTVPNRFITVTHLVYSRFPGHLEMFDVIVFH